MRSNSPLALALLLASASHSPSADRWWDGGSVNIPANGNSASAGGAGTWDTTTLNWDAGAVPHVAWDNAANDTAIFGGTAGAVTVATPITVGGVTITTNGYTFSGQTISIATGGLFTGPAGGNFNLDLNGFALAPGNTTYRFQSSSTSTGGFANANVFTMSGPLTGASSVVISGTQPVYLTGANPNYTGGTTINPGAALGFDTANVTGLAAGSISIGAGATILRRGGNLNQAYLNLIAPTTNAFSLIGNNAGTGTNALDFTNFPNASLAFWDNAGTVTFAANGTITPGANGYRFGSSRAGNWINVGANLASGASQTTATFNNILTGNANLELLAGSGNMRIFGSQTYSGTTTNSAASRVILIGGNLALQNSAINSSGAGQFGVYVSSTNAAQTITTPTIGGLIGSKNISGSGGLFNASYSNISSLTLNPGTGTSHAYSGIIADGAPGMSLTKTGAGTQALSGNNTYSGGTTVAGGTLLINNTSGSGTGTGSVTVLPGATLGGSGNIAGPVAFNGGIISPGNSIGTLSTGSQLWGVGTIFEFELQTDGSGTAGTDWDQLAINGSLDMSALSSSDPLTLDLFTMANPTTPGALGSWDPNTDAIWSGFVTTTGGITGFSADAFAISTSGFQNTVDGIFSVAQNGNNLDLIYTANFVIPEPSRPLLLAAALAPLLLLRRRPCQSPAARPS
jgi:autotransporter-associated beta strand protein